jgi:hypothetical protein
MVIPAAPRIERPTIGQSLGNLARGFFSFLGEVAIAIDSLPLEQKQPFKDLMATVLLRSGAKKKSVEFWTKDDKELSHILSGRAWWVLHKDITGEMKRALLRLGREGKSDQIDAYLCSHFRAEDLVKLRAKTNKWLEVAYLNERKHIVADCLEAHKQGKYTLTIPTLLPLVDGLSRRFRKTHLHPRHGKHGEGVIKVNQVAKHYRKKEHKLWGASFEEFIQRIAYVHLEFGKGQPPNSFNRHWILHGEIADYGSEENSLKAFLLLDTIAQFVRAVEVRSQPSLPAPRRTVATASPIPKTMRLQPTPKTGSNVTL